MFKTKYTPIRCLILAVAFFLISAVGIHIYGIWKDAATDGEAKTKIRIAMAINSVTGVLDSYKKIDGKYPISLNDIEEDMAIKSLLSISATGQLYYFRKNEGEEYFLMYIDSRNQNSCGFRAIDTSKVFVDKL